MLHRSFAAIFPAEPAPAEAAEPAPRTVPNGRLRSTCDFCTKRKKKCDGDGVNRCSFCIAKNRPECHYSVRLLTGPRAGSASKRASKGSGNLGDEAKAAAGAASAGVSGGLVYTGGQHSAAVPLKRARLSPSLATGLIGLKENVFIGEFFRTMGFLPFTTESFIRKAMVSTMFRTIQERDPGVPGYSGGFGDDGEKGMLGGGAMVRTAGGSGGAWREGEDDFVTESKIESAAAACILWSTVGVGCLLGGRPKASVAGYLNLAREALSVCFDDGSVQTARAFTAMAILQNFMGNEEKYMKYMQFAKSIVSALPPEEVPVDLIDTHQFIKACDLCITYHHRLDDRGVRDVEETVANGHQPCSSMLKDPRMFQQAELFRWLVKTDIRLAACMSMDMHKSAVNENGDSPSPATATSVPGCGYGAVDGGDGADDFSTENPRHVVYDEERVEENAASEMTGFGCINISRSSWEPPPPGENSLKFAADVFPECQLLTSVTQSPNVRGGVGELYFQSISACVYTLQGHQKGAMDGLWRCVEIFVNNPGICRFSAWKHLAHCVLACALIAGHHEKYEQLRTSYNSVVDEDSPCCLRIPPREEWSGMTSICENLFCRSAYNFLTRAPAPSNEPLGSIHGVHEAIPLTPIGERDDVGVDMGMGTDMCTSVTSSASDESWAKGIFDDRRQPAERRGTAGSSPVSKADSSCCSGGSRNSVGPVEAAAGDSAIAASPSAAASAASAAAAAAAPSSPPAPPAVAHPAPPTTASSEHGVDRDHQGGVSAPLPLSSSVASTSSRSAELSTTAISNSAAPGEGAEGLELLNASDLEGADADLLDALDALLEDAVAEGFVGDGSSEDLLSPFVERSI